MPSGIFMGGSILELEAEVPWVDGATGPTVTVECPTPVVSWNECPAVPPALSECSRASGTGWTKSEGGT